MAGTDQIIQNLGKDPLYKKNDLGKVMPDNDGVTACLPTWKTVVGYEENDPKISKKFTIGYPRFKIHPEVEKLILSEKERLGAEHLLVFPTIQSAELCQQFISRRANTSSPGEIKALDKYGVVSLVLSDQQSADLAKEFWQHTGEIVSSRLARNINHSIDRQVPKLEDLKSETKAQIAGFYAGLSEHDIHLAPSGMASIHTSFRLLEAVRSEGSYIQFGFPYVDTLKIQEKFSSNSIFIPQTDEAGFQELLEALDQGDIKAVFCEVPSNPLLQTVDLARLSAELRNRNIPLIIDDTIGTPFNVDVTPYADIINSSLTKYISGKANVMAGATMLNPASPFYGQFADKIADVTIDSFFGEDLFVLNRNMQGFLERMPKINQATSELVQFLLEHPAVEKIYYPEISGKEEYDQLKLTGGGYGGLFSMILKEPQVNTKKFFDTLKLNKGPSLGAEFSLASLYTMIAHYHELEKVEQQGVSRYLVRFAIGSNLEAEQLIDVFQQALDNLSK